jgi:serine/threonine protein kinase
MHSESDRAACSQTDPASSPLNSVEPLTGQNLDTDSQMEDKVSQPNDEDDLSEDDGFSGYGKPLLPYRVGFEFTAISQELKPSLETEIDWHRKQTKSQLDFCLSETTSDVPSDASTQKKLIITSLIRVGSNCGAQIVVVNNDVVAKIYDPLYYNEYDEGRWWQDTVLSARIGYDQEVAAYNRLQESTVATHVTPAFYGAWSASIATPTGRGSSQDKKMRTVHLILIEYLHGVTMSSVDPHEIPRPVRSRILKKVLDAEALVTETGVYHGDFHPRNVILGLPGNYATAINGSRTWDNLDVKVHITDFNVSSLVNLEKLDKQLGKLRAKWPGRLRSPLVLHYGLMMSFAIAGWCSAECSSDGKEEDESDKWLWRHYKNDQRYLPVIRDTKSSRGFDPKYM